MTLYGNNNRCNVAVLIPSYDRPRILKRTLKSWLKSRYVSKVFILIQASSGSILEEYLNIIKEYDRTGRVVYEAILRPLGSVNARNILLKMASSLDCKYVLMAEDDFLLPDGSPLHIMINELEADRVGLVGGKIIVANRRRIDPEFFLNLPKNLTDFISKLTGYVFVDVKHGPRYAEFLPQFFMMRKEVLDMGVKYDEIFNTPTSFREESDFQLQIKRLGYKLIYDPRVSVIHLTPEEGGNRPKISMAERIFWKARNHTIFIFKWHRSMKKRIWYITFLVMLLLLYRANYITWIFKGVRKGILDFKNKKYS